MSGLVANPLAIRAFLAICGKAIHLAAIPQEGGAARGRYFGGDTEAAISYAVERSQACENVYFTPNEPVPDCGSKPRKDQIARLHFAFVDIDPPKDGGPFDKANVIERLRAAVPCFVIESGNGIQAFWRLIEPLQATRENVARVEAIQRGMVAKYGGDRGATNVDRLMRLPGTVNWPNAKKRERGCVPVIARTVQL